MQQAVAEEIAHALGIATALIIKNCLALAWLGRRILIMMCALPGCRSRYSSVACVPGYSICRSAGRSGSGAVRDRVRGAPGPRRRRSPRPLSARNPYPYGKNCSPKNDYT